MPRRNYRSEETERVRKYKEAEQKAKLALQLAEDAENNGQDDQAVLHLYEAKLYGSEAEDLRVESAEYHDGTGWSDEGHDLAIDWIQENIFDRADELKSVLKMKAWEQMKKSCEDMRQASQAIEQGCQRMKEASQQSASLEAPIRDMEQASNRLQQGSEKVDVLRERLELLCESDDEDDEDDDEEDYDDDDEGCAGCDDGCEDCEDGYWSEHYY